MVRPYGEDGDDRIAKRVYVGECVGSRSLGKQWMRWIDTIKESSRKRS